MRRVILLTNTAILHKRTAFLLMRSLFLQMRSGFLHTQRPFLPKRRPFLLAKSAGLLQVNPYTLLLGPNFFKKSLCFVRRKGLYIKTNALSFSLSCIQGCKLLLTVYSCILEQRGTHNKNRQLIVSDGCPYWAPLLIKPQFYESVNNYQRLRQDERCKP